MRAGGFDFGPVLVLASFAENRDAKLLRPAFTTLGAGAEVGDFGGPERVGRRVRGREGHGSARAWPCQR